MKALEILNDRLSQFVESSRIEKDNEKYKLPILNLTRAIEELEVLQKANSCLGCKYDDYDRDCFECSNCKRNCNDNFEEEDIK